MISHPVQIAPSILAADYSDIRTALTRCAAAGADWVHIDIMDGCFVPNITVGPKFVHDIRPHTQLPFDVHLMIHRCDHFAPLFVEAGANIVSIHIENNPHAQRILADIRRLGATPGIVLNPHTSLSTIDHVIHEVGYVLLMTVNPGFGGQSFIPSTLRKIEAARALIDRVNPDIALAVDGGINLANAGGVIAAGANFIIAGTTVFESADMKTTVAVLRSARN
jgi:ribulose-phosphate 3-epimerase